MGSLRRITRHAAATVGLSLAASAELRGGQAAEVKPGSLASWAIGAALLALLVALHAWAYRIGENRRRKRAARSAEAGMANRMTEDRERKRRVKEASSDDVPIPTPVAHDRTPSS
jgi:peptidoglycan/LPS O-acetylase OafA/YrhL